MKELFDKKQDWTDSEVQFIEYNMLKGILGCRTVEAVEAAITYASYLNFTGITNGNYPVFLNILTVRNHHVIDALLGTRDPFLFMSSIQPNYFIVATCFSILTKYRKAEIYPKTLGIILGVFQTTYNSPLDGYKIYPPSVADVNSLGKHLNEEKGRTIFLTEASSIFSTSFPLWRVRTWTRTWKISRCIRTISATTSSIRRSISWTSFPKCS
jgi:hypothetical protein